MKLPSEDTLRDVFVISKHSRTIVTVEDCLSKLNVETGVP
jgi:hypothetical protein